MKRVNSPKELKKWTTVYYVPKHIQDTEGLSKTTKGVEQWKVEFVSQSTAMVNYKSNSRDMKVKTTSKSTNLSDLFLDYTPLW